MRRSVSMSLMAALLMTAASLGLAAEEGGLTGKVVDSSGSPIRGVMVSAIDNDHQKSITVMTDTKGRFILDQLPVKTYDVPQ